MIVDLTYDEAAYRRIDVLINHAQGHRIGSGTPGLSCLCCACYNGNNGWVDDGFEERSVSDV